MKSFVLKSPADGLELSCLVAEPLDYAPAETPKGIVQLLHGMCEHKERYIPFMEFLASNGYVCVIHDHRGHGASVSCPEDLGFLGKNGWDALTRDAKAVNDWVRGQYPGLKLTLLGHSMGSMVARTFAKRHDDMVDSLIVCGCPSDNPASGAGKILARLIGAVRGWHYRSALLNKLSLGAFNKDFKSEGSPHAWLCSNPTTLEEYHRDPLCGFVFTADGFYNLIKLVQYCYSPAGWAMANPSLPVHFMSGAADPCRISDKALQKAVQLMKKLGYRKVELKLYPGMRHEILNETDNRTVWNDVLHYLA